MLSDTEQLPVCCVTGSDLHGRVRGMSFHEATGTIHETAAASWTAAKLVASQLEARLVLLAGHVKRGDSEAGPLHSTVDTAGTHCRDFLIKKLDSGCTNLVGP